MNAQKPWATRDERFTLIMTWTLNEKAGQIVRLGGDVDSFLDLVHFYLYKDTQLGTEGSGVIEYSFAEGKMQLEFKFSSKIPSEAIGKAINEALTAVATVQETYLVLKAAGLAAISST